MKIALAIYLFIHGFAHIVGFLVSWKIIKSDEQPYSTKLFSGKVEVGDTGIRVMGILWLLTTLSFFLSVFGVYMQTDWWKLTTWIVTIFSLVICLISLPDTKSESLPMLFLLYF